MDFTASDKATLIDNYRTWVPETTPALLKARITEWLEQCNFQILNVAEHHFKPHGYTCLWLLGESHLAIHTFPEKETCYLELSSCNSAKNEQFKSLLKAYFGAAISE